MNSQHQMISLRSGIIFLLALAAAGYFTFGVSEAYLNLRSRGPAASGVHRVVTP
jgi:hypothetical protein